MLTFTDFLLSENCYLIRSFVSPFVHSFLLRAHHRQYVVAVVFLVAVWFEKFFLTERDTVERVSTDRQTDRQTERERESFLLCRENQQRKSTGKVSRERHITARDIAETWLRERNIAERVIAE